MIYENLNKENFWNEMMEKYPTSTNAFCKWIDEYKKEVNWNNLFYIKQDVLTGIPLSDEKIPRYKFHDIPFDMQFGILLKFIAVFRFTDEVDFNLKLDDTNDFKNNLIAWKKLFATFESILNKRSEWTKHL